MLDTQKFCADCQHVRIAPTNKPLRHGPLCGASEFACDPVTGNPDRNCGMERKTKDGACGSSGLLFTPRNPDTYVTWVHRPGPLTDAQPPQH